MDAGIWLSVSEIAVRLRVQKDTVYEWITKRGLPAHRVGRLWRFDAAEVDAWVRSGKASIEPATEAPAKPTTKKAPSRRRTG